MRDLFNRRSQCGVISTFSYDFNASVNSLSDLQCTTWTASDSNAVGSVIDRIVFSILLGTLLNFARRNVNTVSAFPLVIPSATPSENTPLRTVSAILIPFFPLIKFVHSVSGYTVNRIKWPLLAVRKLRTFCALSSNGVPPVNAPLFPYDLGHKGNKGAVLKGSFVLLRAHHSSIKPHCQKITICSHL